MASQTFDQIDIFPDADYKQRYNELVGLEQEKMLLAKEGSILINPSALDEWSKKHYKKKIKLVDIFKKKPGLFIFCGDVGTGKTSLAETFGDALARQENMSVYLYRLSLKSRGNGMVGDMTGLITSAFGEVYTEAKKAGSAKKLNTGYILLIDEADALAQSRESSQMHHEDKAGVNALIRGIDSIATSGLPVLIVMCTNRLNALDPAVRRRAASILQFSRPNDLQRRHLLSQATDDLGFSEKQLVALVKATGPLKEREYGFTYSDLTQRLLPSILIHAYPDEPVNFETTLKLAEETIPTPPFKEF